MLFLTQSFALTSKLRVNAKLKSFLSLRVLEKVIRAFIISHLYYCTSLYLDLPLFFADGCTVTMLTGTTKYEPISPVVASLHWLPVYFRIQFKILLIVLRPLMGKPWLILQVMIS